VNRTLLQTKRFVRAAKRVVKDDALAVTVVTTRNGKQATFDLNFKRVTK
jgi:hypothetical protein